MTRFACSLLTLALTAAACDLSAQSPVLVKDIFPGSSGFRYDPQGTNALGSAAGLAYYAQPFPCGLWVTDASGPPRLVTADICPASGQGAELNGAFIFAAVDQAQGALWKTDGTPAGTVLVKRIAGGDPRFGGRARLLTAVNGKIYFAGDDGVNGQRLWASDGTAAGTAMVADATSGLAGLMDFSSAIVGAGANVFYTSCAGGCALWRSDGTAAGTVPLALVDASSFASIGSTLYFIANGQELWKSDGTALGTLKVADASSGSELMAVGATLYFSACDAALACGLWKSDGTAAGTALVKAVAPGFSGDSRSLAALGNALLFLSSNDLWRSDGTDAGTTVLANIPGQYLSSAAAGATFLLLTDSQLWASDGSVIGTHVARDLPLQAPGNIPDFRMTVLGNVAAFALRDDTGGNGLYRSDGTAAGTRPLGPLVAVQNNSVPIRLTDVNGTLFFAADDGVHGLEVWTSDGTPGGTRLLKDINPGPNGSLAAGFIRAGNSVFFQALTPTSGLEVWRSDGTEAGTSLVKDITPGPASSIPRFVGTHGNLVLFDASTETDGPQALWRSDGTDVGTFSLGGVNATSTIVDFRGAAYFLGSYQGMSGPWKTDGSLGGTSAVAALPGDNGGGISVARDTLVFFSCDATHGCELWKSDGTAAGTSFLRDVNPGAASSIFSGESFFTVGNLAMFWADDGVHGREPWVTDGTDAGTHLLADIFPGSAASVGSGTVALGSLRFFVANDGAHGYELWKTDGTPEGTALVRDINPGPASAFFVSPLVAGFREVYFFASDGLTGQEMWRSDGTAAGTVRVADLLPGAGSSIPTFVQPSTFSRLQRSGARMFFVADDGTTGFELWNVPIATSMNVITPCRLLDTREGGGLPLADGESRRFAASGACGIPPGAAQIIANVTVVDSNAGGSVEVGPGGPVWAGLSTVSFAKGRTRANNSIFALGTDGSVAARLSAPSGSAHLVMDVTGYLQ